MDDWERGDDGQSEKRLKKAKKARKEKMKKHNNRRKSNVEVQENVEKVAAVESDARANGQFEDVEENKIKTLTLWMRKSSQSNKREKKKKRKSEARPVSTETSEPALPPKHLSILETLDGQREGQREILLYFNLHTHPHRARPRCNR